MATSLFDELPSMASYQEYPVEKPFLNSRLTRQPGKPVNTFPESNSEAVLTALKGLQDKIHNLELDRTKAEKNLKSLAAETSAYKEVLNHSQRSYTAPKTPTQNTITIATPLRSPRMQIQPTVEVETQLRNADARCQLLERQLENMSRMVQNAEKERTNALERQIALERDRGRVTAENRDIQAKLNKMEYIQNRFEDLASRKEISESRIKELEEQLKEEEHQKKLLSDRAAQLQTQAEANRILNKDSCPSTKEKPKKDTTSKKKKVQCKKPQRESKKKQLTPKQSPFQKIAGQPHYRLNLADVPFITGTSTSPSHAVSANLQNLLHDLKHHSPLYCNDQVVGGERKILPDEESSSGSEEEIHRGRKREKQLAPSTKEDLDELILALQDEFGRMTFEHQVLVKQINETYDHEIRKDLECELGALVAKMEKKSDQISTVKRHKMLLKKCNVQVQAKRSPTARSMSDSRNSHIDTRLKKSTSSSPRSRTGEGRQQRLNFLRDMRTVRSAIRQDDLSWD